MNNSEQRKQIRQFVSAWTGRGYEKGESQKFWLELLGLLGVEDPFSFISFEDQVRLDHTSFIDGFIPSTHVLIEQKGLNKDLRAPIKQSDGSLLTPFGQAKRYAAELPYSDRPRWIVTCNFAEFLVYDMERPNGEPSSILLKDLEKELYRLRFLVMTQDATLQREEEISLAAGELVGKLYDALLEQYIDPASPHTLHSLNALCVRLVFCLYAEDAGLFGTHTAFHDYLMSFNSENVRKALIDLFKILDTPVEKRDPYERPELLAFPYVNGGLFADETIEIPRFTLRIRSLLLQECSANFDWSGISPTIFGAVFESTLNPETRRSGGMHYTSVKNIHKVIGPLFLDDLAKELESLESLMSLKPLKTLKSLRVYQQKLASLTFLDPACGSGNFLTETYLSLRRLENRVLKLLRGSDTQLQIGGGFSPIKVSISQFYGIEINDFAATVAKTALWIAESQMMKETEDIVGRDLDFLPLRSYANITVGNALRIDWQTTGAATQNEGAAMPPPPTEETVSTLHFDYIMGNPPFIGARLMSREQKDDMLHVFGKKWKNVGNMDYVCCWYKKAMELMSRSGGRAALVSTNSITQGEQAADLWKPLFGQGVRIDFAHRTFRWDSEAKLKAHVHCVIIGFSRHENDKDYKVIKDIKDSNDPTIPNSLNLPAAPKDIKVLNDIKDLKDLKSPSPPYIYAGDTCREARNINAYLLDAPDIFVESRSEPLCGVPPIGIGNKPIDGGNYLFRDDEMRAFIKKEPAARKYFRPWYGSEEFLHSRPRWCLWLGGCTPAELNRMPECKRRAANVREFRLQSRSEGTRKLADRPTRFHVENMPEGNYLLIPRVSSERRSYIPIGFMQPNELTSDSCHIVPNATLFHFGVLTSSVHMAWTRAVCGRLKSDYRYSKDIVYNNFPWPEGAATPSSPSDDVAAGRSNACKRIEQTAQGILDARALYPDSSLADLYDEVTMPPELRRAHQANDRAALEAYGFPTRGLAESDIVARLMRLYQELKDNKEGKGFNGFNDHKAPKDPNGVKDFKDFKDTNVLKDLNDPKLLKVPKKNNSNPIKTEE